MLHSGIKERAPWRYGPSQPNLHTYVDMNIHIIQAENPPEQPNAENKLKRKAENANAALAVK